MALIVSAATGNFNAGATWVGGFVPTIGDEAQAATGHTITITANANCDLVSNIGTGIFTLNDGVTLTANVTNKSTTTSRSCVQFTAASPASAIIVGNTTGGTVAGAFGITLASTGTLSIIGNATGGSGAAAHAAQHASSGILNINGNVTGGNSSGGQSTGLLMSSAGGTANVVNVIGGGVNATNYGVWNNQIASVNITGICTGGTVAPGVLNSTTGTIRATRAVGNGFGPGSVGSTASHGIVNSALGVVTIEQLEYGTYGQSPTSGTGFRLKKASTNLAIFNYCDTAGAKTLIDATQNAAMPAANHVRSGLSYAGGAATGTLAVPLPSQVAVGVATDNTTGTAFVTGSDIATAVWGAATRTLTAGAGITAAEVWSHSSRTVTGGTVDTLTNAPSVPSASAIASQVRTELSVELGRVDASISSRATAANIPTSDITAIKAKTDNLPASPAATGDIPTESEIAAEVWAKPTTELTITGSIGERAKNQSTVSTTGAQLAAALS